MTPRLKHTLLLAAPLAAAPAFAQTLISDDFEVDSSSDYIEADDGTIDGVTDWAFDYIAAGIPLAPRSMAGTSGGVRMTANDTLGSSNGRTLFHTTDISADAYRVTVDVWMNFQGGTGSTEYANIGVGGDSSSVNSVFLPISGSGAFISFTGDGGSGSDYRWFRDSANTPAGESDNTTLPNSHPSYLGRGSNNTGSFFQALFPSPPSTTAGSPGNIWTTVEIDVDNILGLITFSFDGTLVYQGNFGGRFDGAASIGMADVFGSISQSNNFTLFDNFLVEETGPNVVGSPFCPSNPNSTGAAASVAAIGSDIAVTNNLTLVASNLPVGQFGIFVVSATNGAAVMPPNSDGNLCLNGNIGRYNLPAQILQADASGSFQLALDLTQTPQPSSVVSILAGDTYGWQAWYRDGTMSSNFTSGVEVTFQ
ncbi:MAG: hypothetical protein AAFR54_16710 [Planctomycetota bacterium]